MKTNLQKVKSVFMKKEKVEHWIQTMAEAGWILQEFHYIFFMTAISFHFQKQEPQQLKVCMYDIKYQDDEAIFYSQGWKFLASCENTFLFYSDKLDIDLPILNMKLYTYHRVMMNICNLCFLGAVIFSIKEADAEVRKWILLLSSFCLFALPRLFTIRSIKRGNNWIRIGINIVLACIVAIVVYLLFEQCLRAFALLR